MKRLVLFVIALVFAFCTTVMAAETSPAKIKKDEAATAQVESTPAKAEPAKAVKVDPKKAAKKAEKIKKEEAATAQVESTPAKAEPAKAGKVDPKKAAKKAEKIKKDEAATSQVEGTKAPK